MDVNSKSYVINNPNPITAMVVDDDKGVVSVLSDFLQIKGVQVVGKAYDGLEGTEMYKKLRSDVIFLDVLMERYDGFYAYEKIRAIQPHVSILMMTADSSDNMQEKLIALNSSGIIFKPFDTEEIMHLLNKISIMREISI
jgi:two-component system, chemotaxis family, chemotaxis protein CheY